MVKRYGLVFDLRRCIGCHTCVIACKMENSLEGYSWIKVLTSSGTLADIPVGKYPQLSLSWQPITCMHCQNPPCLEACPEEGVIYKRPDGIVLIDKEKCTGCQLCMPACPYGVIQFNPQENVAEKCTLCSHRLDRGSEPFCAKECIWGAIHFGDIGDSRSEVSQLVASRHGYIMEPEKGTQPSNYYLAP
ncbi:4Fe-4S dicluster domain-containing protein [Chloroflexota bacterium]